MSNEDMIEQLSKGEPEWLAEQRRKLLSAASGMPLESSEIFKKYVNLDENFQVQDYATSPDHPVPETPAGKDPVFLQPSGAILNREALGKGIIITDIKFALKNHDEMIMNYFLAEPENRLSALNNALFSSGCFVFIPDNMDAGTLRIVASSSAFCRNLIIVGRNSSLKLVEESKGDGPVFGSSTIMHLEEGARASTVSLQNLGSNAVSFSMKKALLDKDSHLQSCSGFFGGSAALSRLDSVMRGAGASSEDYEMAFGSGQQRFDITSNIIHRAVQTNGKVVVKGVFSGSSSGIFKGMIDIDENAKYANAYLSEHAMLLGKDSKADAIPGLEIRNNEVKATHSASVAQISEDEMFYLMARGLGADKARKLIVTGFFDPLFRQLSLPEARLTLRALLEMKWEGGSFEEMMQKMGEEDAGQAAPGDIFERHYKYRQNF